jgi:GH24 family phage-related lysozyme (muramidase)
LKSQPDILKGIIVPLLNVKIAKLALKSLVKVPVTRNQQMALEQWAAAVLSGVGGPEKNLVSSKVIYALNMQQYQIAGAEMTKWIIVRGVADPLQLKFRLANQKLFMTKE